MTQERIKEAISAWQKLSDACSASTNIKSILADPAFYCFDVEDSDWGSTHWVNVDEIICAEVYRQRGEKEWRVSTHIEIVDPETNDWDGVDYNVCDF